MRFVAGAVVVLGAFALAGCGSGGADGDGVTVSASYPPSATTPPSSPPATVGPSGSTTHTGSTSVGGSPSPTSSIAQPPDPVVTAGNAAAWSLTRAAPGAPATRQLPTVQCGQDGSVTADGLSLSAGAASLTLTDPAVTVTGTADNDAAGGTFRGRNADTAVTFTWTC